MSVSLILVPLAVAAVTAVHGARSGRDEHNRLVCQVQTRMRDATLLADALRATDAVVTVEDERITAAWSGVQAGFTRDAEQVWQAHFTGAVDEARAVDIVRAVDAAYGRQVQQAVVHRLRERAAGAGLRLETEQVTDDAAVKLVFAVEEGTR